MEGELTLSTRAARALDARAIREFGIPSIVLMENAGRAAARDVVELRERGDGPVVVVAGPGNNGGDGFVIARTLANQGVEVRMWFVGARSVLEAAQGDVRTNVHLWRALGEGVQWADSDAAVVALGDELKRAGAIVDALFGTGLTRALEGRFAEVVRAINAAPAPTVAVDIPSGLDGDTGAVLGEAVQATLTVSFVARKRGFDAGDGPRLCGRVLVREIGIPRIYLESELE